MADYNDFLRQIKEGYGAFVTLPGLEVVEKHGGAGRGVATGAGVLVGGVAGGIIGYALTGGSKTQEKEIRTIVRIPENGIVVENGCDDGSDLRIPWEDIQSMENSHSNMLLLKLTNGIEILLTVPNTGGLFPYRFVNELKDYVNERAKGQPEEGW